MAKDITGIILAGGQSKRMGTEKGLVRLNDKILINYTLEILSAFCDPIFISANSDSYDFLNLRVVKDIYPDHGPMGGIYSCLQACDTKYAVVLSCDMPFVDRKIMAELLDEREQYQVNLPRVNGFMVPVCACYNRNILPVLDQELKAGHLKLARFIQALKYKVTDITEGDSWKLFSINTKADLQEAENIFNTRNRL